MPIAYFQVLEDARCQMAVFDDRIRALAPQANGIIIPFRFDPSDHEAPALPTWDMSYLYAELWVDGELGPQLVAAALPEFVTESYRPNTILVPLTYEAVAVLEDVRGGGDLRFTLQVQATMVGSAWRDQVPDLARRQTLEAWGLDREIIGPLRSAANVDLHIAKLDWEEEILPQWRQGATIAASPSIPAIRGRGTDFQRLDIRALARTLCRAAPNADFEGILGQCRAPIVGL